MFTGIIKELGKVTKIEEKQNMRSFTIKAKETTKKLKIGESISVNGACMTVTKINHAKQTFQFDTIQESLDKTNLSELTENSEVNLEPSLRLDQGLDGHMVQGHIDTTAEIASINKRENNTELKIIFPESIIQHLALKGSITVNGVSLTISLLELKTFSVELIPHTLEKTNLKNLKKGDKVNIEVDTISRYLERLLTQKEAETKYKFLYERNLI